MDDSSDVGVDRGHSPCEIAGVEMVSQPAYQTLLQWWLTTGANIATCGATEASIARLEAQYQITQPPSFRDYLGRASPVADPSWDKDLTNWWPFSCLTSVADGYKQCLVTEVAGYRNQMILFADYSIWCWGWAINCAPGLDYGKVAAIGVGDCFVCDGFTEFVDAYTANPFSVGP